jgi:hypothetical protein
MSNSTTTQTVYVVSLGEKYEGSSVIAVCSTPAQVRQVIDNTPCGDRGWEMSENYTSRQGIQTTVYTNGTSEYLEVAKHTVQ